MIPCEECLIRPICRSKSYRDMVFECTTIHTHLYTKVENVNDLSRTLRKQKFDDDITVLRDLFKPKKWKLDLRHGTLYVMER